MASPLTDPLVLLLDSNGEPISGGSATFYEAGTTNLLAIYSDSSLSNALPNPLEANAQGYLANSSGDPVTVFLQDQLYDIVFQDASDVTFAEIDAFNPTTGFQSASSILDSLSGLTATANEMVYFTNPFTLTTATLTSFARTLLDDSDAETARTTLDISEVVVGTVLPWAGQTTQAPSGYLLCNGQEVSRTTYADLFNTIGTSYGSASTTDNFVIPDLRGRTLFGTDDMGASAASRIGTDGPGAFSDVTLVGDTGGDYQRVFNSFTVDNSAVTTGAGTTAITSVNGDVGSVSIMPPSMLMNWIIKT